MTPAESTEARRDGDDGRVTRDDIEAKFRELAGEVEEGRASARNLGLAVATVGVTLLVVGAYLLGRRRARKQRTVLEIRRL